MSLEVTHGTCDRLRASPRSPNIVCPSPNAVNPSSRLSEEIPSPYNRPFPFHRLILRHTQRSFAFGAGVVLIDSDGVGNLKVAVDRAIKAGCVPGAIKLCAADLQIGQRRGLGNGRSFSSGYARYLFFAFWPCLVYGDAVLEVGQGKRCLAFDIFDALSPHTVAAAYPGPINTTAHNAFL